MISKNDEVEIIQKLPKKPCKIFMEGLSNCPFILQETGIMTIQFKSGKLT